MGNAKHSIKLYLYESTLTDGANDYVARVSNERSLSITDVCAAASQRGGADMSAASMEHGVRLFLKEMGYQLSDGFSVNAEYFMASPVVKGLFKGPKDLFDPSRHSVLFQFTQGAQLRPLLQDLTVEILGVAESGISIAEVIDVKSGSINSIITPNRNLRIRGSKLKVVGENSAVGIYLTKIASNERFKIDSSDIVTNNPSELIIVVPQLPSGTFRLEVCTQFTNSSLLKDPRTAVFDEELLVR